MTDNAFNPPTEAAMAMTGNGGFAGAAVLVTRADLAGLTGSFGVIALVFIMRLATGGEM